MTNDTNTIGKTMRKVIKIDEDKCTGCGDCIPNCPEGALQIIDGKARLISDLFCDGLGACIGHCPLDAISVEEREAELYDEKRVMANVVKQGPNVIKAHLKHLKDHNDEANHALAIEYLKENNIPIPEDKKMNENVHKHFGGCPGSRMMDFSNETTNDEETTSEAGKRKSELKQWPVQLHLISPQAPYYQGKDVVLSADCVAYTLADFHKDFLKGKSLAIACPKLDSNLEEYSAKIQSLIDDAKINTLTVLIMQVPCCRGLLALAQEASRAAKRKVPVKCVVVGLQGQILSEDWV